MASSAKAVFKLAQRPSHTVSNKKGEQIELKSSVKGALVFLKDCTDCHASLSEKAAKVLVEDCSNLVLDVKSTLLSGTLEFVSCKNIVLNLLEGVQIPTLMADSTRELTVNVLQHLQFESLYIHQSSDIEVCMLGDNPVKHKVSLPPDAPLDCQFLVHWEKQGDTQLIICEKVVREGVFPTTERQLKENTERRQRNMQKLAEALADCIQVGPRPRPKDKPTEKGTPSGPSRPKPTAEPGRKPAPPHTKPTPRDHHNIEDDKKEYFENKEELEKKIDLLAKWVKESKHCVIFTGAGISTSTGIPDFRSEMNTVLKTGPGVWELQAKGVSRKPGAAISNVIKALPSEAHMAIVKLHKEGLVKFTVSQNVDGLHLRSGIPGQELAELHGNTNLEKCITCGAKYLRDFNTSGARGTNHRTGRYCDNLKCRGELVDSIIHFGESLPDDELVKAYSEGEKSDLVIVLGSSLRVFPAADIPACAIHRGQKLVICNLQKTSLGRHCSLEIHCEIDAIMRGLMFRLGLEIPRFLVRRRFVIDTKNDKLLVQGLDMEGDTPYSFLKSVSVRVSQNRQVVTEQILSKEPFMVEFKRVMNTSESNPLLIDLELGFHGHYGEPNLPLSASVKHLGKTTYWAEYHLTTSRWAVKAEQ